jgi:hypothetical protein
MINRVRVFFSVMLLSNYNVLMLFGLKSQGPPVNPTAEEASSVDTRKWYPNALETHHL